MDAAGVNGLGVVRGLGELGLKSMALSAVPKAIGAASRHAVGLRCPDPATEPKVLIEFLLDLGRGLPHKGVLLITDDTYLTVLSRAREVLKRYYFFTFPGENTVARIMDKHEQHQAAIRCGVPTPLTVFLDGESSLSNWPDTAYPAVVKGRMGKAFYRAAGRQVLVVNSEAELHTAYERYGRLNLLLQEIIPGGDDRLYTLGSYISGKDELLGVFTGRKLRQSPTGFGQCRTGESLLCPRVLEQGLKLLDTLGYHGVSQVEFKLDPRDGEYKLIEINARFWLWHSLATFCGVNLVSIAYQDALGTTLAPVLCQQYGPKWILLIDDLCRTPGDIRRGSLSLKEWVYSLQPPLVDGLFSIHDPLPTIRMLQRLGRSALNHMG